MDAHYFLKFKMYFLEFRINFPEFHRPIFFSFLYFLQLYIPRFINKNTLIQLNKIGVENQLKKKYKYASRTVTEILSHFELLMLLRAEELIKMKEFQLLCVEQLLYELTKR